MELDQYPEDRDEKDLEKHEASVDRKLGQVEQRLTVLASSVAVLSERVKE